MLRARILKPWKSKWMSVSSLGTTGFSVVVGRCPAPGGVSGMFGMLFIGFVVDSVSRMPKGTVLSGTSRTEGKAETSSVAVDLGVPYCDKIAMVRSQDAEARSGLFVNGVHPNRAMSTA